MTERGHWLYRLRGCGYKMTPARDAIIEFFIHHPVGHYCIEDIYGEVKARYPQIGMATVYRTLDIVSDLGMVIKLEFGEGKAYYEFNDQAEEKHHHHLICTKCGRIINYRDFTEEEKTYIHKAEKGLSEKYDFNIKYHTIEFYGTCSDCR